MAGVDINRTSFSRELPKGVVTEIISKAAQQSIIMQKAVRKQLPKGVTAVGLFDGVTGSRFVAETARKPEGTATYSEKQLRAYKIALTLSFSDEFKRDDSALFNAITQAMPSDLANHFDRAFFFGEDAPVADDFAKLTGSPTVSLGSDPYTGFLTAISTSAAAGGDVTEFDMSTAGEVALLGQKDANGLPLFTPSVSAGSVGNVLGRPVVKTKSVFKDDTVDTLGFAMEWSSVFWGMVEGIKFEEYGGPIYTADGTLKHAGRQDNMFSVICEVEVGVQTVNDQRHVRLTV